MRKRKIWTISMSMVAVTLFGTAKAAQGQGDGGAESCFTAGEHVNPNTIACTVLCCAGSCNGCATDGHYVCG